ncbi:hypothetical protein Taro_002438 [Colocasia esculenta]|uniref:Uncharacterized protein n=1 Tax=Colocasia esculenta TaxID=4460 RepID=A0A843TE65_COLES|nr:hypothetical protein [Colocasia esculenta]
MGVGKAWLLATVLALALALSTAVEGFHFDEKDLATEKSLWDLYDRWQNHHTMRTRDVLEKLKPFDVFKDNVRYIHEFNKMGKPYKLGLNKFGDLTPEEFRQKYAGYKIGHSALHHEAPKRSQLFSHVNVTDVPPSVDWRTRGAVAPVKNQGECGDCWAFSAVGAVEGINHIKTKRLLSLSEQELLDCDTAQNLGCSGGIMDYAFEFIKNNGITTESNYPYTAVESGACDSDKGRSRATVIDGHESVPSSDEDSLLKAASQQPVSVAIESVGRPFQFYSEARLHLHHLLPLRVSRVLRTLHELTGA